jgi:TPR repeat protein
VPENLATAPSWARHAADLGRAGGQAIAGLFYLDGLPVHRNLQLAEYWLRKAADRGNELAKKELASLLKRP